MQEDTALSVEQIAHLISNIDLLTETVLTYLSSEILDRVPQRHTQQISHVHLTQILLTL